MSIRLLLRHLSAVLLVALCTGCFEKKQKAEENSNTVRLEVKVDKAIRRTLYDKKLFTGVLEPLKKAALAPVMGATVRKISVQIGQYVRRGQTLAIMDDVNLVQTQARFETLKAQYDRQKRLFENNAISKAQFESIQAQYVATKRQLEQIRENTTIQAPFSGIVTGISAEEGELYSPQKGVELIKLIQLNPLKVDLNLDEQTVAHVKKGMEVLLTVGALSDTTVSGKIQWVNPSADEKTHTFEVRIRVPNPKNVLKAGYFVEAAVVVGKKENVLTVDSKALAGKRVFVIENDSIAVARAVRTGWTTSDMVEIVSGIEENVAVVISGNKALPDSSVVNVVASEHKQKP